jgi:hypothetical protein
MAVRLNGTSDIKWEEIPFLVTFELSQYIARKYSYCAEPKLYSSILEFFMHNFPTSIQFYDYSKIRRDWAECKRLNYHLTFSFDGWDNQRNLHLALDAMANNINIAAAFNVKRGKPLAFTGDAAVAIKRLLGAVPLIVDGDLTDYRPADPKGGVIVGLRFKLPHGAPWSDTERQAFCLS